MTRTENVSVTVSARAPVDVWAEANEELQKRLRRISQAARAAGMSAEESREAMRLFTRQLHEEDQTLLPMRGWEWTDQKELL